jgi:hypothetical protein
MQDAGRGSVHLATNQGIRSPCRELCHVLGCLWSNPQQENPTQVIENLCRLTKSTGRLGIAGVYVASHAAAGDRELKRGHMDVLWATLFHIGLRGAVPIVLATFPLLAGLPQASLLFDLVFFVVLVSVLLQGASAPVVAKWLGVITPGAVAQETKTR